MAEVRAFLGRFRFALRRRGRFLYCAVCIGREPRAYASDSSGSLGDLRGNLLREPRESIRARDAATKSRRYQLAPAKAESRAKSSALDLLR